MVLDPGPWTLDPGPWTLDPGPWTLHPPHNSGLGACQRGALRFSGRIRVKRAELTALRLFVRVEPGLRGAGHTASVERCDSPVTIQPAEPGETNPFSCPSSTHIVCESCWSEQQEQISHALTNTTNPGSFTASSIKCSHCHTKLSALGLTAVELDLLRQGVELDLLRQGVGQDLLRQGAGQDLLRQGVGQDLLRQCVEMDLLRQGVELDLLRQGVGLSQT